MTLTDLASIGTLISGIAVVVSLVYLSLQIRQNTKHSQALIQQGRAARISDTALRLAELRGDSGLDKCFEGSPDVTAQDVARFVFVSRAIFVSAEDSFFQRAHGLLDDAAFESFENSVRSGMGSDGLAIAWRMTEDMYEPRFSAFMNRTMGDLDHARRNARSLDRWKEMLAQAGVVTHPPS